MLSFKPYDFSLTANGSQTILAIGSYFRIQSSTGAVSVTVDSVGTLPGMLVGQGFKGVKYSRLLLTDVSGAPNVGVILTASDEFVDNRTYGVNSLDSATILALSRPLVAGLSFYEQATHAANTPTVIFLPAANVNGAVIHSIDYVEISSNTPISTFVAKGSAPATIGDGEVLMISGLSTIFGALNVSINKTAKEHRIAAGKGLYYISGTSVTGGYATKSVRYTLL
jgi:hypothetical protein